MVIIQKIAGVIIILGCGCLVGYADQQVLIPEEMQVFSFKQLLGDLPDIIADYQSLFYGIAAIMFAAALVRMLNNAKSMQDQASAIIKVLIGVGVMVSTPYIINQLTRGSEALASSIGADQYQMSDKLYNLAHCFSAIDYKLGAEEPELAERNQSPDYDPGAEGYGSLDDQIAQTGFWDRLGGWFDEGIDSTKAFFGNPLGGLSFAIKRMIFVTTAGFFFIVVLFCSFLITIMDTLRTFLLCTSTLILPICIAGCFTQVFRSQSISYMFGVLGNILWPVGWAVGNMAILVIIDGFIDYCRVHLNIKDADQLLHLSAYANAYDLSAEFGSKLMSLPAMSLFSVWLMLGMIAIWSIVVTFYGPRLIKKFVQTGADFFDSVSEGTTRMAGSAIGAAAAGVASGGAAIAGTALLKSGALMSGPGASMLGRVPRLGNAAGGVMGKVGQGIQKAAPKVANAVGAGTYATGKLINQGSRAHWDPSSTANLFDGHKFIKEYRARFKK